ncbi:hypothetical protein ACIP11_07320 [Streptomyces albogriseolus]|uniref:hypothetical protein n=1 Tax=Streptomyces albogriseolus TaxID=1887 RepID=UPI0037FA83FD
MPGTETAYLRYVALGDSQTEGVGDGDDVTGLRGFAFEQENRDWCLRTVAVLEERRHTRARN